MHTGNEIIDMRDLEWAVELISALIKKADRIQLP
jgi:putative aminopeptidase FrvX